MEQADELGTPVLRIPDINAAPGVAQGNRAIDVEVHHCGPGDQLRWALD